jgi:hypothetical protein
MDKPQEVISRQFNFGIDETSAAATYFSTRAWLQLDTGPKVFYRLEKIYPDGEATASTRFFTYKAQRCESGAEFPEYFVVKLPYFKGKSKDRKRLDYERESLLVEINALKRLEATGLVPEILAPLPLPPEGSVAVDDDDSDKSQIRPLQLSLSDGEDETVEHALRSYLDGVTVRTWVEDAKANAEAKGERYVISTGAWLAYAIELTKAVRQMHRERVTHGYLSPDHVIVGQYSDHQMRPMKPRFVNFESKFFFAPAEVLNDDKHAHPSLRRPYDSPQKRFQKEGMLIVSDRQSRNVDWYVASDIFSLGLHLLYVLLGTEGQLSPVAEEIPRKMGKAQAPPTDRLPLFMEIVDENPKSSTLFEREIFGLLNGGRRNLTEAIALTEILFAYLRIDESRQPSDLDQVLNTIEQFSDAIERPEMQASFLTKAGVRESLGKVIDYDHSLHDQENCEDMVEPIRNILRWRSRQFEKDLIDKTESGGETLLYTIRGGRRQIIDSLVETVHSLREGWTLDAVTSPTFWFSGNVAVGRFASRLMIAAKNKARIRWRLIVRELDLNEMEVAKAIRNLLYVTKQLEQSPGWDWQWTCLPDNRYNEFLRRKESFLHIHKESGENKSAGFRGLLIAPDYRAAGGELTTLRIWDARNSKRIGVLRKPYFDAPTFNFRGLARYPHRTTL